MSAIKDADTFEDFVQEQIAEALVKLVTDGGLNASLTILKPEAITTYLVPDGRQEIASFFVDKANENQGALGYLFLTETWSLTVSNADQKALKKYLYDPQSIVDHPMKEERVKFEGRGYGNHYVGHVPFVRGDDGEIILQEIVIEDDDDDIKVADVADLLIPMVE